MAKNISSGGINAILSTMKHAQEKVGLFRSAKALMHMNTHRGFDCPGCAWPEPKDRSKFEFCENGAKALMNATTTKVLDETFFKNHSILELNTWSEYALSNCGRLVIPALKLPHETHFKPISYPEAFDIAAKHFRKLSSPDRAVFYTSGRASNEAAFLYQLFARNMGTNNLCDCSNLCHESSGVALKKSIGFGKGCVQIDDFLKAQAIFLIGHNPSTNHPRMLSTLREARKNGAEIIVINPLIEPGLKKFRHPQKLSDLFGPAKEIATHYFQVRVGGDHALFTALVYLLLCDEQYKNSLDNEFIQNYTSGFNELKCDIEKLDIVKLIEDSGLTKDHVYTIAKLIAKNERIIYAWGMGITQTTYAVNTIEAISNIALLRGHIGKVGAGLCPVRGHSNVQGNRTMGVTEKPSKEFLEDLSTVFHFQAPKKFGFDVVESIHEMLKGNVDVFMGLGGNFLSASPDTEVTTRALSNCSLAINVATSLNRTHLLAGKTSLLLPCLTRVEKDLQINEEQIITVENSMSIVHASIGAFAPVRKGIHSEVAIIAQIAKRTLPRTEHIDWQAFNDNYALIREVIGKCLSDFRNYNERIKNKDGFILDHPAVSRKFPTTSGRAQFISPIKAKSQDLEKYDLLLTTIRSHDQFNTAIYGLDDRYRGIKGERRVVFMSDYDIKRLSLSNGSKVDLLTNFKGVTRTAENFLVRAYEIKQGCAAAYFPEANVLIPLEATAFESNTPSSKMIPIVVRPHEQAPKVN